MITQLEAKEKFLPLIYQNGNRYRKFVKVLARQSTGDEHIVTMTKDGKETENTTKSGDWIIRNPGGEEYILAPENFNGRYQPIVESSDFTNWGEFQATGETEAVVYDGEDMEFVADWGEPMVLKRGDMIATSNRKYVYRIAINEFNQTYRLI